MSIAPLLFEGVTLDGPSGGTLDFEVEEHHAAALVGDAASGVNALGDVALGLATPREGRALVWGTNLATLGRRQALAFRRRVGYVPDGDGLLQNLSLRENVALPLRFGSLLSPHEIDGRLNVILAAVRLGNAADLRPAEANEEQRRRAAVARAIVFDPELVLMENPFDGMGTRTATHLMEVVRGGETTDGARRTVFITAQFIPDHIRPRLEDYCRIVKGRLERHS